MKRAKLSAIGLMALTNAAAASPIAYEINFDGSISGPAGTGTILYDSDTHKASEFSWNFGADNSGSAMPFLLNSAYPTNGSFLWDVLTNTGVCGSWVGTDGISCELSFPLDPNDGAVSPNTIGSGYGDFLTYATGNPIWYGFGIYRTVGSPALSGYVTLQEIGPVPLPSSAWLLLSGIGALLLPAMRRDPNC